MRHVALRLFHNIEGCLKKEEKRQQFTLGYVRRTTYTEK